MQSQDLPYKVEYAPYKNSFCQKCRRIIGEKVLRIATMIQSFEHDSKVTHWHHVDCFFFRNHPRSIDDIANYENIRYEDQQVIRQQMQQFSGMLLPESTGKKRPASSLPAVALRDYGVEYSKSGRAQCVGCRNKILKDAIRVKKMFYDTEIGMRFGGQAFWHHLECFADIKMRQKYGFFIGGEQLPGLSALTAQDQKRVQELIKSIDPDSLEVKKLRTDSSDDTLEDLIKKQSSKLFETRRILEKYCEAVDLKELLTMNKSGFVEGLLDRCADFLTFGALAKCQKCLKGDLIFAKYGYKCDGMVDEWTGCGNFVTKPIRMKCKLPVAVAKKIPEQCFNIKQKLEDRAVRSGTLPTAKDLMNREAEKRAVTVNRKREALYNLHIVVIGNLSMKKDELKRRIEAMGGKLTTKLQSMIAVVISTEEEVQKMNKRMQQVKALRIQVVPEEFLTIIETGSQLDTMEQIKAMEISDWGSDPMARMPPEEIKGPRQSLYLNGAPKVATLKLKDGVAVDHESGMQDVAHIYRSNGIVYNSALTYIDIMENKNSYYKLQLLESDIGHKYYLFRAWGRIGTKIGSSKTDNFLSAKEACAQFERYFHEKTGCAFNGGASFTRVPGKFYPIEVNYEDDKKVQKMNEKSPIPSKLPEQTQSLVKMLFDVNLMKQTMIDFKLDLEKMPLGRLSKNQLHDAYQVLTELNNLIVQGAPETNFIGLSNKFFSLVPHNFGLSHAPIIDNLEMIQHKREILDNLIEFEVAYEMLKDNVDELLNPIDAHYEQLKTELTPIERDSDDFELINKYVQNTHAQTHNQYSLEIVDIFRVHRRGERHRFKPFKNFHNRQLLWHGSRTTNFVGILSHGLKIAPPEAPASGYMFGKGIYFADMVSKSSNYCFTNRQNNCGIVLLSEVALGNMHELTGANYIERLPDGKHSTKGIGKNSPDPSETIKLPHGVIVPLGKSTTNETLQSNLLYNEYIVYDVAQVKIQYLLKLKFNFENGGR